MALQNVRSLIEPTETNDDGDPIIRRNVAQEELEAAIAAPTSVWLDLDEPTDDEVRWLQDQLDLHPMVVEDMLRRDRRPSLLVYPNYIFLSLFQPDIEMQKVTQSEIHCLIGENFFVTVRDNKGTGVDDAYQRVAQNPNYWERGIEYFLYLTIQQVIDTYYPLLDAISDQLNDLEEKLLTYSFDDVSQKKIYRVKQQLINMRQMVAPQREVLADAIGEEQLTRTSKNRDLFRHLYERLVRLYDIIDSQRDLSSNVLDLMESQVSTRMTSAVNRLTIISMIFLPLTFLIGVFELNFITTKPVLTIPLPGLVVLVGLLAVMGLIVVLMVREFSRRGWL